MDALDLYLEELEKSQSPYKGFNRENPNRNHYSIFFLSQSPNKGFNREAKKQKYGVSRDRLNPPIRGSIGDEEN